MDFHHGLLGSFFSFSLRRQVAKNAPRAADCRFFTSRVASAARAASFKRVYDPPIAASGGSSATLPLVYSPPQSSDLALRTEKDLRINTTIERFKFRHLHAISLAQL